jgi:4'-phosphopantetheinyl transferase
MDERTVALWHLMPGEVPKCLSPEERAQADRFPLPQDRERFIAFRSSLRHILGSILDQPPDRVRLSRLPSGKPILLDPSDLHFNLAHADDRLLLGVTRRGPLGVDLERLPSDALIDAIGDRVLSRAEQLLLERRSGPARRELFAAVWARKEAYVKADGAGVGMGLDRLDVLSSTGRVLRYRAATDDWAACPVWTVRSIPAGVGYAAAVAAPGDEWRTAVQVSRDGRGATSGSSQPNRASADISRSRV